jgi:hypothetical protein
MTHSWLNGQAREVDAGGQGVGLDILRINVLMTSGPRYTRGCWLHTILLPQVRGILEEGYQAA